MKWKKTHTIVFGMQSFVQYEMPINFPLYM